MDDKITKEVEKEYYVRKIEKLDSERIKFLKKASILGILDAGLLFAGSTSKEFGFMCAALVPGSGMFYYYLCCLINIIKSSNTQKKLKELEEKEKIYEELKKLGETEEMEGKTR